MSIIRCEYRSICAKGADIEEQNDDHNRDFHYKNVCIAKNEKSIFLNHTLARLTVEEDEKERLACLGHDCDQRYTSRKSMAKHVEKCSKVNWISSLTTADPQAPSTPSLDPQVTSTSPLDPQVNESSSSSTHPDTRANSRSKGLKRPAVAMEMPPRQHLQLRTPMQMQMRPRYQTHRPPKVDSGKPITFRPYIIRGFGDVTRTYVTWL